MTQGGDGYLSGVARGHSHAFPGVGARGEGGQIGGRPRARVNGHEPTERRFAHQPCAASTRW